VLPLNASTADEPTNRRISVLVLNKAAEQAFFRDGGRVSIDQALPASDAISRAASTMKVSMQSVH
jgi:chemotaxis protein MotB